MKTNFGDMTVKACLAAVAAKDPAPGGGSAAALSGAMAAALTAFVCRATIGKKKYAASEKILSATLEQADGLQRELLLLAEEDKTAFLSVIACKSSRASLLRAAAVSRTIARKARGVKKLARVAAEKSNPGARTDAKAALLLAGCAIAIARMNIEENERPKKKSPAI